MEVYGQNSKQNQNIEKVVPMKQQDKLPNEHDHSDDEGNLQVGRRVFPLVGVVRENPRFYLPLTLFHGVAFDVILD